MTINPDSQKDFFLNQATNEMEYAKKELQENLNYSIKLLTKALETLDSGGVFTDALNSHALSYLPVDARLYIEARKRHSAMEKFIADSESESA